MVSQVAVRQDVTKRFVGELVLREVHRITAMELRAVQV